PENIRIDRDKLWDYLNQHSITFVTCTPSFLQSGKDLPTILKPPTLVLGGEALSATLLHTLLRQGIRVFNDYGPTETSISSVTWECPMSYEGDVVPIGRPVKNVRLYVLDTYQHLTPVGTIGELYIGGTGVTRGYLNRPGQTAERFLLDPFSEDEGARMYRTGDLVRYLPDGNLEYVGRSDFQVKIRGFRIELGEIEAHLVKHEWVSEAVVLALGDDEDKQLVAYVVSEHKKQLARNLRSHLAAELPQYMIPAAYVRLDAMPLTVNDKLDRKSLPAPGDDDFAREAYESPRGDIENILAAIWSHILKIEVERIGRHDSFFALGGHSLLAVRLMNRVSSLGANMPISALFASPGLAAFAAVVQQYLDQQTNETSVIAAVSRDGLLPLSFAQQRLWFLSQLEEVSDTYHIPLAVHLRGTLHQGALKGALDSIYSRHEALRSVFINVDGSPQVQILSSGGIPLRLADLRDVVDQDRQLQNMIEEETRTLFDLAKGPLIRASTIQLADEEHVLLITQHHIVSDGWSMGILLRELSQLYTAYVNGESNPLRPFTVQYPDYAAWQRQWLSGERLKSQSDYWRTAMSGAPVLIDLPTDRPRPAKQSFQGGYVPIDIDSQTTSALKQLSQKYGVTLFMIIMSAWSAVLSRLSGQDDIVIGTPSANRGRSEIEPLIGFFVNTLALRVDLSGEPTTQE
ncbi:hypothetical protein BGX28_001005, partial [Mortierella sp. GBA30]